MKRIPEYLRGRGLIDHPLWNRATAFTDDERCERGLHGLLPPVVETLQEQAERAWGAYETKQTDMERHIYLRALQDTNETLFYRIVVDHLTEIMPIIYTPTVGEACERFSEIYRRPRGLFLSYPQRARLEEMLRNYREEDIEAIVVTDGERILGLGDQGVGGMGIPIGKLSLYVACGGITPLTTLPIVLDVGTNNAERLADPEYLGWRHERVTGQDYLDFLDTFVTAVKTVWPRVLLQFEDFAFQHATPLLERYRDQLCMFNDDVQGTAAVAVGTLLSGVHATRSTLADQTVVILGGGSAGCGIGAQIIAAMVEDGVPLAEARTRLLVVDREGLLLSDMAGLRDFQQPLAQDRSRVEGWTASGAHASYTLLDVVRETRPTALIGVSGQPNLFTEDVIRALAEHCPRPIVFPLSNPTSRMEAQPADILQWSDGRALIATGSPIAPVPYGDRSVPIAQCNNTYIFPAVALGVLACGARRISDEMLRAGARALAAASPAAHDEHGALLPPLTGIRESSRAVAFAIAKQAVEQGHADALGDDELRRRIAERFWEPVYG